MLAVAKTCDMIFIKAPLIIDPKKKRDAIKETKALIAQANTSTVGPGGPGGVPIELKRMLDSC